MSTEIQKLLQASVDIAARDRVIKCQKALIEDQSKAIALLEARLAYIENKLLREVEDSGRMPALLQRQI